MLINLKNADYIILDEESQFYIFEFKIIDFVCDSNDKAFKTAKITVKIK